MTKAIEERAQAYLDQIDAMGGAVRAIELGFPQREIQQSAYQYQQEIEARSRIVVGMNAYTLEDEPVPPLLRIDPDLERQQVARVQALRAQRNNAQVRLCCSVWSMPHAVVRISCRYSLGRWNVMPHSGRLPIPCVRCSANIKNRLS